MLLDDDVMEERPHAAVTQANDNNHEDENCNNQDMDQLAKSSTEEQLFSPFNSQASSQEIRLLSAGRFFSSYVI